MNYQASRVLYTRLREEKMDVVITLEVTLVAIILSVGLIALKKVRHSPAPYALGEREEKLEELERWRDWAIENVVSVETLDDVTNLYHTKLKEIENHK
jgi:hypothetical protein